MNTTRKTSARTQYRVRNGDEVRVTVRFGNGQLGSSSVMGPPSRIGQLTDWLLGHGETLRGRTIEIRSTVTDANSQTDRLVVTYTITGGDEPLQLELSHTADYEGASQHFLLTIQFK
jgi:hypothetical protein